VADRLDGLVGESRSGRPPSISLERVEDVIVATLESTPATATPRSRTSMAARSGLSPSTIGRIWKDFEIKPHVVDGFKVSSDPDLHEVAARRCGGGRRKSPAGLVSRLVYPDKIARRPATVDGRRSLEGRRLSGATSTG
jgi:hypothetical protein